MPTTYFMRPVGMRGPVKIGCSDCPRLRLVDMQRWSPFALEIAATVEGPPSIERRFHARFVHLHSHFEWFNADDDLTRTIDEISRGVFDIGSLPPGIHLYSRVKAFGGARREAA